MNIKSDFIFKLAEKYGLLEASINPINIENNVLISFCLDYKNLSYQRDLDLKNYLINSPKLLRSFVPYGKYFLNTVSDVIWYYDELVVSDPFMLSIEKLNKANILEIADIKNQIYNSLQYLLQIRECIDEGYILFGGDDFYPNYNEKLIKDEKVQLILQDNELQDELDKIVDIYVQKRDNNISGVIAKYRGLQTMRFVPTKNEQGEFEARIEFIGQFEHGSIKQLKELDMMNLIEGGIRENYIYELIETIENFQIGQKFNSFVLYNRDIDIMILQKLNKEIVGYKQEHNLTVYQAALPFMRGINPKDIMELRLKMPEIFKEFRSNLIKITLDAVKEHGNNKELINYKVEERLNTMLLSLSIEQKNTLRKTKTSSLTNTFLPMIASFAINSLGFDLTKFINMPQGINPVSEINNISQHLDQKEKLTANPLYFLWKLQNK